MKTRWQDPRILYGVFTAVAFLLSLRWTFPSEAVKERLIYEAGAHGWQIDVQGVRPSGLLGVRMTGVALTDASGLKVPIERLDASLGLLPLLVGQRELDYSAALYDGTVEGSAALSGQSRRMEVEIDGVNLARAIPLHMAAGRELAGKVTGRIELTLPGGLLEKSSGTAELSIAGAGLGAGQIPAPPLGKLSVPAVDLGSVKAAAKIEQGRVALDKLEARGGEIDLTGESLAVVIQPRMAYAPITGQVRVRFQPSLRQKAPALFPVMEARLASYRTPDGSYRLPLTGSLLHPDLLPAGSSGSAQPTRPMPTRPPPSTSAPSSTPAPPPAPATPPAEPPPDVDG